MYECIQITLHGKVTSWPSWLENLIHFNHFALVINSSINILIYCWRDKKFLHIMLITCGISSRQQSTGLHRNRSARPISRRESPNVNPGTRSNSNAQLSPQNQVCNPSLYTIPTYHFSFFGSRKSAYLEIRLSNFLHYQILSHFLANFGLYQYFPNIFTHEFLTLRKIIKYQISQKLKRVERKSCLIRIRIG